MYRIVIVGCVDLQCSFRIWRWREEERHEDGRREMEERVCSIPYKIALILWIYSTQCSAYRLPWFAGLYLSDIRVVVCEMLQVYARDQQMLFLCRVGNGVALSDTYYQQFSCISISNPIYPPPKHIMPRQTHQARLAHPSNVAVFDPYWLAPPFNSGLERKGHTG